jgi:CheY-like chemotaxis protein
MRLLVADDSVTIHKIVKLTFASEDVEVETETNGDSLLDKVRSGEPDLILLDVFMPGCSGYEICERIKDDPDLSHIPVILMAGAFERFDEMEAARAKADAHLLKPFDTAELIKLVQFLAGDKWPAAPHPACGGAERSGADSTKRPSSTPISARSWDSFVGPTRVLDLWDQDLTNRAETYRALSMKTSEPAPSTPELSEQVVDCIVEKVIRRMSQDVIREIAWEVVPELSEILIKQQIKDNIRSGS